MKQFKIKLGLKHVEPVSFDIHWYWHAYQKNIPMTRFVDVSQGVSFSAK